MKPLTSDDNRHGTKHAYHNLRCRCDRCRAANTAYMREHRQTEKGSMVVKVQSRAKWLALKLLREEYPDTWYAILDQAWLDVTGHLPAPTGRPRRKP